MLTQEQGKPLEGAGSRFELGGAAGWAGYTSTLKLPEKVIVDDENAKIVQTRKPIGVVGSILPWNWPLMIAVWHVVPAIRAGNTVVMKPSPYTPLSSLRLAEIISAVLPPGVLNCVAGEDELGQWMTEHENIQKIIFTGSIPFNLYRISSKLSGSSILVLKSSLPISLVCTSNRISFGTPKPGGPVSSNAWDSISSHRGTGVGTSILFTRENLGSD